MRCKFYFKYALNVTKRDKFRKRLMTIVCAGGVAFAALCTGYLGKFSSQQQEYLKSISQRELSVYIAENGGFGTNSSHNNPISDGDVQKLMALNNAETVTPLLSFTLENATYSIASGSEESIDDINQFHSASAVVKKSGGVPMTKSIKYQGPISYSSVEVMDSKCYAIDSTVENGAYISYEFAKECGIMATDLNHLELTVDTWVPEGMLHSLFVSSVGDFNPWVYTYVCNKMQTTLSVRGILGENALLSDATVYAPADVLLEKQKQADDNLEATKKVVAREAEIIKDHPESPYFSNPSTAAQWAPNAYYVVAKDVAAIDSLKAEIQAISPNFQVVSQYQDLQSGIQFINNNRDIMIYISLAVLVVVLLLMALIYINLIDKRKFEFSVLRANGMTKREVRRLIYLEMLLQFIQIFLAGLFLAILIYLIWGKWLGYAFQFDVTTFMYLFVISLGSVVLPTIISLLFVNKFEPDQIMRN